jgi:hypothetical protein
MLEMCIPRLDGARGNRVEIPVWIKEVCFLGIGGGLISAEERRFSGWVQPENAFLKSMILNSAVGIGKLGLKS